MAHHAYILVGPGVGDNPIPLEVRSSTSSLNIDMLSVRGIYRYRLSTEFPRSGPEVRSRIPFTDRNIIHTKRTQVTRLQPKDRAPKRGAPRAQEHPRARFMFSLYLKY